MLKLTHRKFLGVLSQQYLWTMGFAGLSVISGVLIARLLGPSGRGEYAAFTLWIGLTVWVFGFGIGRSLQIRVSRDPTLVRAQLRVTFLVSLCMAVLVPFLALGLPFTTESLPHTLLILVALLLPFSMASDILSNMLIGRQQFLDYNKARLIEVVTTIGLLLIVLPFVDKSSLAACLCMAAASLAMLFFKRHLLVKHAPDQRVPTGPEVRSEFRAGLATSTNTQIFEIPKGLSLQIPQLLIAPMFGTEAFGLMTSAAAFASPIGLLSGALMMVIIPMASKSKLEDQLKTLVHDLPKLMAAIFVLAGVFWALSIPGIPWLYGPAFAKAVPLALPVFLMSFMQCIASIIQSTLLAMQHTRTIAVISVMVVVIQLIGALLAKSLGFENFLFWMAASASFEVLALIGACVIWLRQANLKNVATHHV